jgi:hypothetical protein
VLTLVATGTHADLFRPPTGYPMAWSTQACFSAAGQKKLTLRRCWIEEVEALGWQIPHAGDELKAQKCGDGEYISRTTYFGLHNRFIISSPQNVAQLQRDSEKIKVVKYAEAGH